MLFCFVSMDFDVRLFPDAEMLKYIPQHLVRGDFTDDGAEVVEGLAEVLGKEVGSLAGRQGILDLTKGLGGLHQCLAVAKIGHYGLIRTQSSGLLRVGKQFSQLIKAESSFGGNI